MTKIMMLLIIAIQLISTIVISIDNIYFSYVLALPMIEIGIYYLIFNYYDKNKIQKN